MQETLACFGGLSFILVLPAGIAYTSLTLEKVYKHSWECIRETEPDLSLSLSYELSLFTVPTLQFLDSWLCGGLASEDRLGGGYIA